MDCTGLDIIFTHIASRFFTTCSAIFRASAFEPHVTSTTRLSFPATMLEPPIGNQPKTCHSEGGLCPRNLSFPWAWAGPRAPALLPHNSTLEYCAMASSPIKFGTSGWRGLIADDF